MTQHAYGWNPQRPDIRDEKYKYTMPERAAALPSSIDMRPQFANLPVFDQGQLGSCTSNSAVAMLWYAAQKQNENEAPGSRLFHYYNERSNKRQDTGSTIRQSVAVAVKYGVCDETEWPYDISQFKVKPSKKCYTDAALRQAKVYRAVAQDSNTIKSCLSSGYPVMIGFTVYDSFESDAVASTGVVPMPGHSESVLGGHAVLVCGYDDSKQHWIVRNSWSSGWGDKGYFYFPYQYLLNSNLSSDFWTITGVE